MNVVNDFPGICPEDCSTDVVFPAVTSNPDCLAYDVFKSQIGDLVIVPTGATDPFGASWTGTNPTVTVTPDTINNDGVDNTTARRLRGIGSLGESEDVTREGPYGQTIVVERSAPLEFIIDDASDLNRAFANALACNPTNFTAYIGTADHLFGKAGGMSLSSVSVQMPLSAGTDDIQQIIIRADVKWKKAWPERTANNPFN